MALNFHFHYTANHDQPLTQLLGMQSLSRKYQVFTSIRWGIKFWKTAMRKTCRGNSWRPGFCTHIPAKYWSCRVQNALISWCSPTCCNSLSRRRHAKSFSMSSHGEELALNQCSNLQMKMFFEQKSCAPHQHKKNFPDSTDHGRIKFLHFLFTHEILDNMAMEANWLLIQLSVELQLQFIALQTSLKSVKQIGNRHIHSLLQHCSHYNICMWSGILFRGFY